MIYKTPTICYTKTDEAPSLATYSFFPIIKAFIKHIEVAVEIWDISLAARIISTFSKFLREDQRMGDSLAALGAMTIQPETNIIKLPNISASIPQLKEAIDELRTKGYNIPQYPDNPKTESEIEIRACYDKIQGSAVNPVLRQGNSDRRAPKAVKEYVRKYPHCMMPWSPDSRTRVATMDGDDFYSNEKSLTIAESTDVQIEFVSANGLRKILKKSISLKKGEILDSTLLNKKALISFFSKQMAKAKEEKLLFSLHLKATMMKISDPIIFGYALEVFFKNLILKHSLLLKACGIDFRNGVGDLLAKIQKLPNDQKQLLEDEISIALANGPSLAMVNFEQGISNFHVPNNIIIDASMPAMIRAGGKMYNSKGELQETLAVIPDSTYAPIYQEVIDFCKQHGALDPKIMGSVSNIGLMADAAQEYGSHDKTFEISEHGVVRIKEISSGQVLLEHIVEEGDIWRACQTKHESIQNWIQLAVTRARETGDPTLFWLDEKRPHDAECITKVKKYLADHNTNGLDIKILSPAKACKLSLTQIMQGKDIISVTGNVLRDYLTDLFPILEVGTSAKMYSIVPLMNGGGLFETGAGGSAPKHVHQFLKENYLRWDSLGEFFALVPSLEHISKTFGNIKAQIFAETLNAATVMFLENNKSPGRKLGTIDNRGSHFYIAFYWAQALAMQNQDMELKTFFIPIAEEFSINEEKILTEINSVQGKPVDLGGYYLFDEVKTTSALRPSATLNEIIEKIATRALLDAR